MYTDSFNIIVRICIVIQVHIKDHKLWYKLTFRPPVQFTLQALSCTQMRWSFTHYVRSLPQSAQLQKISKSTSEMLIKLNPFQWWVLCATLEQNVRARPQNL